MERVRHTTGRWLSFVALVLLTCACFDITPPAPIAQDDDVAMVVDFSYPNDTPRTKGIVSGTENAVSVMQLICFDASGLYLGTRTIRTTPNSYNEKVTSGGVDATTKTQSGQIIARVPAGTARIHFIANRDLPTPLDFTAGTSERIVMNSLTTPSSFDQIVYWGYHFEKTDNAMLAWMQVAMQVDSNGAISLKDGVTPNKVHLIRDRARIQITFDSGLIGSTYSKVEWLIHNGRDAGLIAPYNSAQVENMSATPPVNQWTGYTDANGTYATTTLNEYTASGRDSLWRVATGATDENRTFDSSSDYQFVFEDSNQKVGNVDGRLKLILKVYFANPTAATGQYKYLVILLKNDDVQVPVLRNNTYVINIRSLDARGYPTLEAAIKGEEFANAPVESPRELTTVANENYILQIALDQTPETADNTTTSVIYSTTGQKIIPFKFLNTDNTPVTGLTAADFEVSWEEGTYGSWTPSNSTFASNLGDYLSYNSSTQCWEIKVNLTNIGVTDPWKDYLVIKHKASKITRYVHIYGIQNFAFSSGSEPTFTKVNGVTYSETVSGTTKTYDVYKLTFRLPDTYSEDLYPINIRMATTTLEPYSDAVSSARSGVFGVVIKSTSHLTPSSTTTTDWNYKASSWGYWYEYSLPSMPHEHETNQGLVEIYFLDTRSSKGQTNPTSVGLFLDIPNFGGLRYFSL